MAAFIQILFFSHSFQYCYTKQSTHYSIVVASKAVFVGNKAVFVGKI